MTTRPVVPALQPANPPAKQAEDALWLHDIEEQLIELARASAQRWQKIAVLMIEVEQNELWQGAARSYTAWVRQLAARAGVHESNLWRALKAGTFYNEVRAQAVQAQQAVETQQERLEDAQSELQTGRREPIAMLPAMPAMPVVAALPALGDLDSKASPESLELVEKISRAAPPEKTAELVQKTLAGETTRRDLREVWRDYRPAVAGTARGRGPRGQDKTPPTAVDGQPLHVVAADIVQALRADRGSFIDGRLTSQQWRVHTEVAVRPGTTRQARRIDAVCTEMATSEQRHPGFHAVEIKVRRADLASDHKLTEYADFADTLWLAVPAELAGEAHQLVPVWVGVLAYEASAAAAGMLPVPPEEAVPAAPPVPPLPGGRRLRVVQPAGAIPRKADLRSELAFELLKRLL
jgi:hypothetical protein